MTSFLYIIYAQNSWVRSVALHYHALILWALILQWLCPEQIGGGRERETEQSPVTMNIVSLIIKDEQTKRRVFPVGSLSLGEAGTSSHWLTLVI